MQQRNAMGIRIRELRKQAGMTATELAGVAGIAPSHLTQIERGESRPAYRVVAQIAAALGVPVSALAATERDLVMTNTALTAMLIARGVDALIAEEITLTLSTRARQALLEALSD